MSTRSVLVVDDDRLVRDTLCEVVSDFGCTTRSSECGLQALDLLAVEPGDLVVSDVDMPDISGFELLARMRAQSIATPVVLMSARADASLQASAERAGAQAMLAKPIAIQPFTSLLADLLDY